nr:MAG TPA: hypothetical protein [Caudoviricetes sp.]
MKRENVKKNIGIISAFADGKTIQILNERGEWVDLTEREGLPIGILEEEPNNFRTKPEPKYRPFKDEEECWQEMLKHQPFGWVKCKEDGSLGLITLIISEENIFINGIGCNSERTMRGYTFADGTPFGILEED